MYTRILQNGLSNRVPARLKIVRTFRSEPRLETRSSFLSARPSQQQHQHQRQGSQIPTYILVSTGGAILIITTTYYTFLDRVPLTNRQRWIATTMNIEQELGDAEYQQLLQQFRGAILPPSHRANKTVQRVGSRIVAAAQEFMEQQHPPSTSTPTRTSTLFARPYTFTVVQSDMANAFCLPGNHVFVMTGLFQYARTEDELAAVLGHEST
jgi:predicted Zn-dependent protease